MITVDVHVGGYGNPGQPKVTLERLSSPCADTVVLKVNTDEGNFNFFLRGPESLEAMTAALDTAVRAFFLSESEAAGKYRK